MTTPTAPAVSAHVLYADQIRQWRAQRLEQLAAPDGWLTLIGLEWLTPGTNRVGSAAENTIVLSTGPAHLGIITLTDDCHAYLRLTPGADATIEETDHTEAELLPDTRAGSPTIVRFGTASFSLIERDGRIGVRVKDREATTRTQFGGLEYYPLDPGWRITAAWVSLDAPQTVLIPSTLGTMRERTIHRRAVFTYGGQQYAFSAVSEEEDGVLFVFADATTGRETYGGGRFLVSDMGDDGQIVLDFNKAINPPCAFTPYATCPLAPAENRFAVPVTAGEKHYGAAH